MTALETDVYVRIRPEDVADWTPEQIAALINGIQSLHVVPMGPGFRPDIDPYEAFLQGVERTKADILASVAEQR